MRIRAIAVLVAVSCGAAVPVVTSGATAAPVAHVACIHARIGGHRACLAQGRACTHRYQRQYLRYGFTCVKRHGHYKLAFAQQQQG